MPEGWVGATIGDVADVVGGSTPSTREPSYWGGAIPWIVPSEVTRQEGQRITVTDRTITEAGLRAIRSPLLPVGTVLLSSRATVGAVALAGIPMAINQGFAALVAGPTVDPRWLMFWCQLHRSDFEQLAGGSTFPEISKASVRRIAIDVPSLGEQRRIADLVASMDMVISASEGLERAALHTLRSVREELIVWSRDLVLLGSICKIAGRLVDPAAAQNRDLRHIGIERIEARHGRLLPLNTAAEDGVTSGKFPVADGDVVYSKIRPELRKAALPGFASLCSADAYPLRPNEGVDARFLLELLLTDSFSDLAVGKSGRTKMPKINRAELMAIAVPELSTSEQAVIAELSSALRSVIDAAAGSARAARRLRADLLNELMAGMVDVPESYDRFLDGSS